MLNVTTTMHVIVIYYMYMYMYNNYSLCNNCVQLHTHIIAV